MRYVIFGLAIVVVSAFAGHATDLKELLRAKFQLAELIEVAAYSAEKCPGLHVVEAAVTATAKDEGVTDDDIYTPEWKFWESRGQMNAKIGYEKNPTRWCESMWQWLGPNHPPGIKRTFRSKD